MEKGILALATEKIVRDLGDDAIKLKGFLEVIDGPLLGGAISILDNNIADKHVPEPAKTEIREMVSELVEEKDSEQAALMAAEIQQKYLNIPGFDDSIEKEIVHGMLKIAFGFILKLLQSKNETEG